MAKTKTSERIYNMFNSANSDERIKWQSQSQKGYDFYLNDQLTEDEKDALEEAGMPTFQINRITPIIETMKYFVTANNPRWKAVAVDGSDTNIAQIHSDISDYCWNISNGKAVYGSVILDALAKGVGYFFIDVDTDLDNGKGDVVFKRIDPYDVYPDPMSRDFLLRDASFIIVKKAVPKNQLKQMFPEHIRKINKASEQGRMQSYSMVDRNSSDAIIHEDIGTSVDSEGAKDQIIDYYECFEKIRVPFYNLTIQMYPSDEDMKNVKIVSEQKLKSFIEESQVATKEAILSIDRQLQAGEIIEERALLEIKKAEEALKYGIERKKSEIDYAAQEELNRTESKVVTEKEYKLLIENEQVAKTIIDSVKFYEKRVKVSCSLGSDVTMYEYILPITDYPIIPVPYLYTGTPYPMSAVIPMIGKQQEVNKAHQVMLHNANLASNLRWIYEEGSVPEDEWEQYSSAPGALLKYRPGFTPPTPVLPAPINNAFFTVTQEGKSDMEYIAGIPSAMMGFTQEQAETYRGLLANDEFGTRRIKAWMNSVLEPALEHTGEIFKQHSQAHYKIDKVFRIVQPNTAGDYDEKETRINIPIYNDYGDQVQLWNDYASSRFDIRIVAGAVMPLNRWALLEEYFRWFQAGLIDDVAMLSETDVRGKEQILERKSLYAQLQQQIQSLESQMKDKMGENETLKRQLVQAGIRHQIGVGSNEIKKDVLETEAQQKYYRKLMQDDLKKKTEKELEQDKTN
tara:strand:+ start:2229 stop:4448 length:2220 start_codon:yes stop_codon:yes gene_type:complete